MNNLSGAHDCGLKYRRVVEYSTFLEGSLVLDIAFPLLLRLLGTLYNILLVAGLVFLDIGLKVGLDTGHFLDTNSTDQVVMTL